VQLDAEPITVRTGIQASSVAKDRRDALADIIQAEAGGRRPPIGLTGILDRNRQHAVATGDIDPNHAAVQETRDAVGHRILDERLQE
jgi:hypothetical protein